MAYEIKTWERDGLRGESRVLGIRVRNLKGAVAIFACLATQGLARITMAQSGTSTFWDLWRSPDRDIELDADIRTFDDLRANPRPKRRER